MNSRPLHLTVELLRKWMFKLLDALAFFHASGWAHRDIKPENILLGPNDRIVIADFGLARQAQQNATASPGTICYAAPELLAGQPGKMTQAVDVWSLGITFLCLINKYPYRRPNRQLTTAEEIVHYRRQVDQKGDIVAVCPHLRVPDYLLDVIDVMIKRNPSSRPSAALAANQVKNGNPLELLQRLEAQVQVQSATEADLRTQLEAARGAEQGVTAQLQLLQQHHHDQEIQLNQMIDARDAEINRRCEAERAHRQEVGDRKKEADAAVRRARDQAEAAENERAAAIEAALQAATEKDDAVAGKNRADQEAAATRAQLAIRDSLLALARHVAKETEKQVAAERAAADLLRAEMAAYQQEIEKLRACIKENAEKNICRVCSPHL